MRRADRLFRLVELLRSKRLATGGWLAEQLHVSLRTLYRDIETLREQGQVEVGCDFCGQQYTFDPIDAEALFSDSTLTPPTSDDLH